MSTISTIAVGCGWNIHEEMITETTWINISHADFVADKHGIRVKLPEGVIDAIRAAKPSSIPHLRKKG